MSKIAFITLGDMGGSMTINLTRSRGICFRGGAPPGIVNRCTNGPGLDRSQQRASRVIGRNGAAVLAVSKATACGPQTPKPLGAFSGLVCNPEVDMVSWLTKPGAKRPPQAEETMTTFESLADSKPVDMSARRLSLPVSEAERRRRNDRRSWIFSGRLT
jgi:hypothetical protein